MATPSFLDQDNFTGKLNIDFGDFSDFDNLAADFETETLIALLGQECYNAFVAGIAASPVLAKWSDLTDGLSSGYQNGDQYYRMRGTTAMLECLFYVHYRNFTSSAVTSVGEFQGVTANSQPMPQDQESKMISIHNEGVEIWNEIVQWIAYQNTVNGSDYYANFQTGYKRKDVWY